MLVDSGGSKVSDMGKLSKLASMALGDAYVEFRYMFCVD